MHDIGIIVIGRNEGQRLQRCLASVVGRGMSVVYVDSASTDGSPALARALGAEVVDLDMSRPFAAARARNDGFARLIEIAPGVRYVQFVDGDCEMVPEWFDVARQTLDSREDVAVVCGRVRERFPKRSIYNRLADIEWNTPAGEVKSCGGIAMMRAGAFQQVKGFDPSVVAGEEPELCQRLRNEGWKVLRLEAEMTLHDSAMLQLRQWWKRSVRSGYGAMDVATRFGKDGLFVNQTRSARRWTIGWTALLLVLPVVVWLALWLIAIATGGTLSNWRARLALAGIAAALCFALVPAQMLKIALRNRRRAGSWKTALLHGFFTMLAKWANVIGQRQYQRDRAAGRLARLIEYKAPSVKPVPSAAFSRIVPRVGEPQSDTHEMVGEYAHPTKSRPESM